MTRKIATLTGLVLALGIVAAGCGEDTTAQEPAATTQEEEEDAATTDEDSRCLPVPRALKRGIAEGLTVQGGGKLGKAAAVRSGDFERVWYVSAVIRGPGMGTETVGTWAISGALKAGGGLIIAADALAREFSDWGAAAQEGSPAAEVRGLENDGAQKSRDCLAVLD